MNVKLDKRIYIEYPVLTQDAYGAAVTTWKILGVTWANVEDVIPSRSESVKQGLSMAKNQTRFRFRYRSDVTSAMRFVIRGDTDVVYSIVGGPAELGRRQYTECVGEVYSS